MAIELVGQGILLIETDDKKRTEQCSKGIGELLRRFDCMMMPHIDVTTAGAENICIFGTNAMEVIDGRRCKTTKLSVQKSMIQVVAKPHKINLRSDN